MTTLEVPLTQGLVTLIDEADYDLVMAAGPWCAARCRRTYYARRNIHRADGRHTTQNLHALLTGFPITDHRDGDGLNNRRENLRRASRADNNRNRRIGRNNRSGYHGVSWASDRGSWRAHIRVDGRTLNLGGFATPVEAAVAYDEAARDHFGEFARLNFSMQKAGRP